ncbi:MAG: succinate--CoA ligase subunit alpha [Candidatus Magasanikbacteria bacterium]|jgi:succinyl-CoA synthetase alpha subunit|nr:succinate--CoA ligase subunit alpha [Candidatus Magasanikbacteria bacterium]MBT4221197.1 succinate--CoA ligase subunit alpha [Candidatus Magasanikbacteria bacterium]MBT4350039.1 succinate--CoA ligase subunit alpha [Candidatus Magasanikbacteria bacterium]MBT4541983.1 succinate--CoA ligase subunit alpha [Candidatus Magasanikbacteria bacterium]MBT6252738.1 succinate--CoA ligase subunit alpha [Candidatus Magasanikbacteria bacterium]
MAILIDTHTKVLVQGITGKEGKKAARAMLDYHTDVIGGVRPGKGGESVEGCPVFNTVEDAVSACSSITVSSIYVPPFAAKQAIMEAIDSNIPLISVIIERVPIKDTAYCLAAAKEKNIRIVGPSSLGFVSPGVGRVGVIGGTHINEIYHPGSIGIISRSGGMTNEISWQIRKAGMGQSTAVHVGGDLLMGTTYTDLLSLFEKDDQTKAVVLFGEHGGSYEFDVVDMVRDKGFTKPLAVYVGGKFAQVLPEGMNIGHAGAIVARGQSALEKETALSSVGVMIAKRYEDLVTLIKPFS